MDYTETILDIMKTFLAFQERSKEKNAKFKAIAYRNAIASVKEYGYPITTKYDVDQLKGIGAKTRAKMYEIVETGELQEVKKLQVVEKVRQEMIDYIHGVGPVKADEFINVYGVKSINDLRVLALENPDLFTEAQMLSLVYYEDLKLRIPRQEMYEHEKFLGEMIVKYAKEFTFSVVGSYRRKELSSGDIDVLITYKKGKDELKMIDKFKKFINRLTDQEYIIGALSGGNNQFMGICNITVPLWTYENKDIIGDYPARRIDIHLTKPEEFPTYQLYFTGSQKFNINFRKHALLRGYTLNQKHLALTDHGIALGSKEVPEFRSEEDIFDFLGVKYLKPEERTGPIQVYVI